MKPDCSNCGGALTDTDRFCPTCGTARSVGAEGATVSDTISGWERVVRRLRQATDGEYVIVRQIGRGGMAAVFLAVDAALNRNVAIKVLSPALLMAEGMAERFREEAITIARLDHPNIISIHGVRRLDDLHFFVMKYVEGRALDYIIRNAGPLGVPVVQGIIAQVAPALTHAHRHGVIHRDVKPANLLVDSTGRVIVSDFGIAKVAESQGLTQTGSMIGTAAYMSPEQCAGGVATRASDQYSLAIVVYELLTGRPPFTGTPIEMIQAHVYSECVPLRTTRPDCTQEFERALHRMLAKDPAERWPSLEEAQAALGAGPRANTDRIREMLAGLATPDPDVTQMLSAARPRSRAGGRSAQTRPPDPAKVVIQNVPDELETGERASLAGLVVDATGSTLERELEWSSTSPDVVSVEGDPPTLTGIGPGTARIRASVRGSAVGAEAGVRVIEARACTLELSATSLNLEVGEQSRIIAVPRDRRGASVAETVHWSSADSAIAAASATGIVTGHRIGTTELTATIGELHRIATVTVGAAAVTSILVSPVKATVVTGDALRIEAMPCDRRGSTLADRPVTWSSRSPGIASVTADGIVTGWAEGTVEIVAVCEDVSAVVSLRIEAPAVTRLELEGVPAEIRPGQRFRLAATAVNTRDEKSAAAAEWKSSRSRVASVTRDGVVETHRPGRAVVAARSGTLEAKAELNVLPALQPVVPARKPESGGRTRRIAAGVLSIAAVLAALVFTIQSIQANATPEDQPGVTEDQQSGTAEGTTTGDPPVAVAEEDSSTASPDTGTGREQDIGEPGRGGAIPILVLDAPSRQIAVGDSMVVEAEFRGPTTATAGQRLTWATSDARIATVSAAGLVRGVSAGEVRITAGNAATADTVMVRVSPRRVAVRRVEVTPVAPSVMVGETISLTVRTLDDEGQPLADRNVAWTSSNRQVATVDGGTGMVTGLRPGNAVITAESEAAQTSITLRVADPPAPPPVQPTDSAGGRDPEPLRFASVSAGGGTCASVVDGPALCWGFGNEGTQPAENGFDALVAGWGHRCGLRSGQAFCWGANDHGQIGDGTTTAHSTPTPVAGGGRFVQIAAGEFHTCAIDGQGAAHCWGENDVGQLGTGSARDSPTPARVDEATPFVAIATGRAHTCALDGGSRAWCWGDGLNGQIGNGMTQHQREPVPVRTDDRFRMIAAGGDFTCGLTVGGKAMCWGNNNDGQLGDTRNRLRDEPRDVARETEFQSITTGRHHACALSTDGRVYCWGANGRGQLGTGTTSANSAPSPVEGPVRFTAVTAGNLHTCGLARDGAVYCWGDNSFGQIEQGGAPNHTTPFAIRMTR